MESKNNKSQWKITNKTRGFNPKITQLYYCCQRVTRKKDFLDRHLYILTIITYLRKKFGSFCPAALHLSIFVIMKICKRILFTFVLVMTTVALNAQKASLVSHTVSQGQTLYSISKLYNTTVDDIIKNINEQ